jgi:t-SNARE complex subunit (syntaxin)
MQITNVINNRAYYNCSGNFYIRSTKIAILIVLLLIVPVIIIVIIIIIVTKILR